MWFVLILTFAGIQFMWGIRTTILIDPSSLFSRYFEFGFNSLHFSFYLSDDFDFLPTKLFSRILQLKQRPSISILSHPIHISLRYPDFDFYWNLFAENFIWSTDIFVYSGALICKALHFWTWMCSLEDMHQSFRTAISKCRC